MDATHVCIPFGVENLELQSAGKYLFSGGWRGQACQLGPLKICTCRRQRGDIFDLAGGISRHVQVGVSGCYCSGLDRFAFCCQSVGFALMERFDFGELRNQ